MHRTPIAAALMLAALGTTAATATPATAAPTDQAGAGYACGYDGYNGSANDLPLYNHCGRGDIVLKVDHWWFQTTYDCVAPGVHYIDQGNSNLSITGATYDGHSCSFPGPVAGP
ncbi:MAG TPA: DUF6355 family natural product biosynthesis protein [Pseudonocardiaceae bacterium]|jgi:hypothetical protein|nr:DUF6355 family natural product biosynthesis protein [Pseudonocardiaceae bacterium]